MKYKVIILAILSIFLCTISYGAEEFFTWEDEQGGLHITDQRPPDGVKILDISPSNRKAAEKMNRQRLIRQQKIRQDYERKTIESQAAQAREKETDSLRTADSLIKQAEGMRQKKGNLKTRRRYRRKAARYERRAQGLFNQAEAARKQAEILEKKLGN